MEDIPERDWKKLRKLKENAISTACKRIFHKVSSVIEETDTEYHKAYLRLWKVLKEEDGKIALMFDDLKRSTGIFKLAMWKENGVLSDKDFEEFTEKTKNSINAICSLRSE